LYSPPHHLNRIQHKQIVKPVKENGPVRYWWTTQNHGIRDRGELQSVEGTLIRGW